jgi:hypothetical protein
MLLVLAFATTGPAHAQWNAWTVLRICYTGNVPVYMARMYPGGLLQSPRMEGWTRVGRCYRMNVHRGEEIAFAFAALKAPGELVPIHFRLRGVRLRRGLPDFCVPVQRDPLRAWSHRGPCTSSTVVFPRTFWIRGGDGGSRTIWIPEYNSTSGLPDFAPWRVAYQELFGEPATNTPPAPRVPSVTSRGPEPHAERPTPSDDDDQGIDTSGRVGGLQLSPRIPQQTVVPPPTSDDVDFVMCPEDPSRVCVERVEPRDPIARVPRD